MISFLERHQNTRIQKVIRGFVAFTFVFSMVIPPNIASAQSTVMNLPLPGAMVPVSVGFEPTIVKGLTVYPDNPLQFDFIIDSGESAYQEAAFKDESTKLIKYFLAALTTPEEEMWVNLSPYEKDRIVPDGFGETEMGRDLLAQDYILKQLTSSMMYPEDELGGKFWKRVYEKAYRMYGVTEIPINTFNKIWIVPEKAVVYEHGTSAFVVESHLKVLLEEDYVALQKNLGVEKYGLNSLLKDDSEIISGVSSDVIKEIIIPEIEKEVNHGKNFAQLRQIYNSVILASWYKDNLKESMLGQVYVNKNKTKGIDVEDKQIKQKIYNQYLEAFNKGVYNYIKEDYDENRKQVIPRKYFSGGTAFDKIDEAMSVVTKIDATRASDFAKQAYLRNVRTNFLDLGSDSAMAGNIEDKVDSIVKPYNLLPIDRNLLVSLLTKYKKGYKEVLIGTSFAGSSQIQEWARKLLMGVYPNKEIAADPRNIEAARNVTIRSLLMKAGLGSSFKRKRFLKRITGRDSIANKATDSLFENVSVEGKNEKGEVVAVTLPYVGVDDVKIQRLINMAQNGVYKRIIIHDMVNDESKSHVTNFYNKPYVLDLADGTIPEDQKRTYSEVIAEMPNMEIRGDQIDQLKYPVLDVKTNDFLISEDPESRAPGGHGFLATYILDEMASTEPLKEDLVTIIANSEGVNDFAPAHVVGWMVRTNKPIVIISTTRTPLDSKGGVLGVESLDEAVALLKNFNLTLDDVLGVSENDIRKRFEDLGIEFKEIERLFVAQIMEIAQAKMAGKEQVDLFQKLGLLTGEIGKQYFNTNVSAYYETILRPFLRELKGMVGKEKYFEITTADLIANPKDKVIDGIIKSVLQLEGAKASAILNLNKFLTTTKDKKIRGLMKKYDLTRLLYIVNFEPDERIGVFAPIKFAWDLWLYAYADMFKLNFNTGVLERIAEGEHLPAFDLMWDEVAGEPKGGSYYKDVENDFQAFGSNASVKNMESLKIRGKVLMRDFVAVGNINIRSDFEGEFDLRDWNLKQGMFPTDRNGNIILKNMYIQIDASGNVSSSDFDSAMAPLSSENAIAYLKGNGVDIKDSKVVTFALKENPLTLQELADVSDAVKAAQAEIKKGMSVETILASAEVRYKPLMGVLLGISPSSSKGNDSAMSVKSYGGINLNPAILDMQIKRDGAGIPLPMSQQNFESMSIEGFLPIIINITPINNLPLLLGVAEDDTDPINLGKNRIDSVFGPKARFDLAMIRKENYILN